MFKEIRQKLGAVLQQGFLETNPRYFLSWDTSMFGDRFRSAGGYVIGPESIVGYILGEQMMHSQR